MPTFKDKSKSPKRKENNADLSPRVEIIPQHELKEKIEAQKVKVGISEAVIKQHEEVTQAIICAQKSEKRQEVTVNQYDDTDC